MKDTHNYQLTHDQGENTSSSLAVMNRFTANIN
jgi:hypothetical protein